MKSGTPWMSSTWVCSVCPVSRPFWKISIWKTPWMSFILNMKVQGPPVQYSNMFRPLWKLYLEETPWMSYIFNGGSPGCPDHEIYKPLEMSRLIWNLEPLDVRYPQHGGYGVHLEKPIRLGRFRPLNACMEHNNCITIAKPIIMLMWVCLSYIFSLVIVNESLTSTIWSGFHISKMNKNPLTTNKNMKIIKTCTYKIRLISSGLRRTLLR